MSATPRRGLRNRLGGSRGKDTAEPDPTHSSAPVDPAAARLAAIERSLTELTGSSAAAVRVLYLVNDPDVAVRDVAAVVQTDPIFTARLLAFANSAAYAQRSPVLDATRAAVVVGMETIRTVAAQLAADSVTPTVPDGFREHSASTAAGCVAVSAAFGMHRDEAFSLGLLHDIGWPILWSVDAELHGRGLPVGIDTVESNRLETERFGTCHAEVSALLLESWGFGAAIVDAVRRHHDPGPALGAPGEPDPPAASAASNVIACGDALAHMVLGFPGHGGDPFDRERFGFSEEAVAQLAELTESYATEILTTTR